MYLDYWQLTQQPFEPVADRVGFYPCEAHEAALLKLRYVVENQRGAALLAGPSGSGKTMLVNLLRESLAERFEPIVHLVFPQMSGRDLLVYFAEQFGAPPADPPRHTVEESIRRLEFFLTQNAKAGRQALAIVDEAHLLEDCGALETLRLLLNFENAGRPALGLLLVGQTSLLSAVGRLPSLDERVAVKARENAEEHLLDILFPAPTKVRRAAGITPDGQIEPVGNDSHKDTREKLRKLLRDGHLDDREVELEVSANASPMVEVFTPQGMEEMGLNMKDLMSQLMPKKTRTRKVKIPEAMELLTQEEAARLVDMESVAQDAIQRAEQSGIVFIDEIDKIAARDAHGPDVSRAGVQRDLLPIVEGSTVNTKYGAVKTDHILFVASGAFHSSKPSDLIPEFQGRFPIRVELKALTREDFIRILTEPENALTRQYVALMETEGVRLSFTQEGVGALAEIAAKVNGRSEDIGARRLHTVLERLRLEK